MAKLDIKAAFDSLSHRALLKWLLECAPCEEAWCLWKLCSDNTLVMMLADEQWTVPVRQGIMQGTSFSADVFARVIDHFLSPLLERWHARYPEWQRKVKAMPHMLLYADDILVLASNPRELQQKFRT